MKKWQNISDWFLETEDSDIELHAETENTDKELIFPAHGFVVKKISPVFKAMLETGNFEESKTKIIKLKIYGDETDALTFVRWFYMKDLKVCDENSYVALMKTAHMYEVQELFDNCELNLSAILKSESICKLYRSLNKIASEGFLTTCKEFMKANATYIFLNNLHIPLDEETVAFLVESGTFQAHEEQDILDALWYWIEVKCIFNGKGREQEQEKVMISLIKKRRWQNIQNMDRDKSWHDLIKEFGQHAPENEVLIQGVSRRIRGCTIKPPYINYQ